MKDTEFGTYHRDTLTSDWDWLRETNPARKPLFDAVGANPPFSYRWDPGEAAESAKLNALRTHKKGLMQQLFPAAAVLGAAT